MSLTVLHNAAANVANRLLTSNDAAVSRSVAKLSAGQRVLAARDDAASLSIGSRLSAEVASLGQAAVNAGQAAAMLQIADGAAGQIDSILQRMKSLSVQAGSDQLAGRERALLDTEYQTLKAEVDRIAKGANFNGRSLLEGDVENGVVYTVRSTTSAGTLYLNDEALTLGSSFSQEDLNAGRVSYRHNPDATATSDRLVVSVSNRDGEAIGTIQGEVSKNLFETAEYHASTGLDNIKASAAYARGGTGAGVTIAVIDTGVDIDHVDLDDQLALGADIVDTTAEGLSFSFAGGSFAGAAGEVSAVRLYDVDEGVDLFESGNVPTLNITGSASAATVTLSVGGVDYSGTINVNSGGAPVTSLGTLTEVGGTKTIDIGLDTDINGAGAITSAGPQLVTFSTPTTGDGNDDTVSPDAGHGTHVAGIALGEKNGFGSHGVAYEANLIGINTAQVGGGLDFNDVADAIDLARANGADIVNLSLGSDGWAGHTAMQNAISRAVNAGMIVVASTGNSGLDDPAFPANFAISAEAKGMLIAVAATDDADELASFSNKAGAVQQFTVSAPGVAIVSSTNDGAFGALSGTSMSAPTVSGAMAVLKDLYGDSLSGQELASLLFTSTTDLGAAGQDSLYGRGLINLDKATMPQLELSFNIDALNAVAGKVNVAPETTVKLDRAAFDYTSPFEGRVESGDRSFTYKVGTGSEDVDNLSVKIGALTLNALGLEDSAIDSQAGADQAGVDITAAIGTLVKVRAGIGASQNRLDIAINNLATVSENTEAARSQLMDLDIAAAMVKFTSQNMLTQASVSMLAQANQQSRLLLSLLG